MFNSIRTNPILQSPHVPQHQTRSGFLGHIKPSPSFKDISLASATSIKAFFGRSFTHLASAQVGISDSPLPERIKPKLITNSKKPKRLPSEPLVYYDGPCETLDQLPDDKLQWIKDSSPAEGVGVPHLSRHSIFPIVLRKPHKEHMSHFRCSVECDRSIFVGSFGSSEKCGKNTIQTELEETFLCDIDEPSSITLKVYSQPRSRIHRISNRTPEECVGQHRFDATLERCDKKLRRYTLEGGESGSGATYQVLVVFGTYVSHQAQTLLTNRPVFAGYMTLYVRGQRSAKWNRYWAVLFGTDLRLYDFEAKETRPPVDTIPLACFLYGFRPPVEDDDGQVDVGAHGLALQFSKLAAGLRGEKEGDDIWLECRVYVLPDSVKMSQEWENAFEYVRSLLTGFRDTEVVPPQIVPSRYLW
ncbi:hypothetical protein CLU79DRAFT_704098 [Phycomyces nitens]|nr:hypothetical protein CLU79DRAFT_704098 [Phycomyces nitens]